MSEPRQPPIAGRPLDTPERLQAYLNSCPPGLTKLNLIGLQIPSLRGVNFPPDLIELSFYNSQIHHLQGVRFPPGLKILDLTHNQIESLEGVHFPSELTKLSIILNKLTSLEGVQFPPGLIELNLGQNKISSLAGVQFPPGLKILKVDSNIPLTSLVGVQFPPELVELDLTNNYNITSLEGVQFPSTLMRLSMHGAGLKSLTGIISPNKYVKEALKQQFLHLYLRDLHPETSALKAARQSQKATIKEMSDLSQQSMHNQLKAVTSFLREDMEARARQHAEQPITGSSTLFVRVNGMSYPVPLNVTMTVQSVLDYMNEHYYISVLVPNCSVMKLVKEGRVMDPARALADYGVLNEETLHAMCAMPVQTGGKRAKRTKRTIKPRNKKSKSRKNRHKHK